MQKEDRNVVEYPDMKTETDLKSNTAWAISMARLKSSQQNIFPVKMEMSL